MGEMNPVGSPGVLAARSPGETHGPRAAEMQPMANIEKTESDEKSQPERDRWSSRLSFILGAIGSAVGLGNFWRFPYLTYKWGGGTFLIPYVIALLTLGIPLLLLELSLGQRMQRGDIGSFGNIHPRLRGVGVASVLASFCIVVYYAVIIGWTAYYFVESFSTPLPWGPDGDIPPAVPKCQEGSVKGNPAAYHLYHTVLHAMDENCEWVSTEFGASKQINGGVYGATVVVWFIVLCCVWRGVKTASYAVLVTMPVPIVLLIILLIRAVTLDGAGIGIEAYLGGWDMSLLSDPGIWTDAAGQIFFSIGVCLGVMTSYGSYQPKDNSIVVNALIISLFNSLFSFFCGFAVFGILGFMAKSQGVPVSEVAAAGIGLSFITYPSALSQMGGAHFWCVITFLTLFLLGIDSAFSMVEAITTVLCDAGTSGGRLEHVIERQLEKCCGKVGKGQGKSLLTFLVCLAGLLCALLFSSDIGFYWLDIVDHYINNYTVLIDGLLEAVAVSWVWGWRQDCQKVNRRSANWFTGTWFISGGILIILVMTLALDLAVCEDTAWKVGEVEYECPAQLNICDFQKQRINEVDYFVGSGKIWSNCKKYAAMHSITDMVLIETKEAEGCVSPVAGKEFCKSGPEVLIGFLVWVACICIGWSMSFLHSGLSPAAWLKRFVFSGCGELMDFISWAERDKQTDVHWGQGTRFWDGWGLAFRLIWCWMIKYFVPMALAMLLIGIFKKDVATPYGGYPGYMQGVCWALVGGSFFLVAIFVAMGGEWPEDLDGVPPSGKKSNMSNLSQLTSGDYPTSHNESHLPKHEQDEGYYPDTYQAEGYGPMGTTGMGQPMSPRGGGQGAPLSPRGSGSPGNRYQAPMSYQQTGPEGYSKVAGQDGYSKDGYGYPMAPYGAQDYGQNQYDTPTMGDPYPSHHHHHHQTHHHHHQFQLHTNHHHHHQLQTHQQTDHHHHHHHAPTLTYAPNPNQYQGPKYDQQPI